MSKLKKDTIEAKGFAIQIYTKDFKNDYISLTDIARYKSDEPFIVINNWLRGKDNIQFLGLWESMHNPDFNTTILLNSGYKQSVTHRRQHSFSSSKNRYIHTFIEN